MDGSMARKYRETLLHTVIEFVLNTIPIAERAINSVAPLKDTVWSKLHFPVWCYCLTNVGAIKTGTAVEY